MSKTSNSGIYAIAAQLKALPITSDTHMTVWAPMVIDLFRGTGLFCEFDNAESAMNRESGGRFHMVRSIRNSHVYGALIFAASNEPKRPDRKRSATAKAAAIARRNRQYVRAMKTPVLYEIGEQVARIEASMPDVVDYDAFQDETDFSLVIPSIVSAYRFA